MWVVWLVVGGGGGEEVAAGGDVVCGVDEALEGCEGGGEFYAGGVAGDVPAAHVAGDAAGEGAEGGGLELVGEAGVFCGGEEEVAGADGVVECGVLFAVCFFAAVVQDGGGDADAVLARDGTGAAHFAEVICEDYDGFGVADEATGAEAAGGVIFAAGGCRHGPEACGGGIEHGADELAHVCVLDKVDFEIELVFHGIIV